MLQELPVFPLSVVLFPGGILPLRIFEPRYLSMVSDCIKNNKPFLVCQIKQGKEVGKAAKFHEIGTLAKILDFDQLDDGFLGITCRGTTLARVDSFHVQPDQLIVGQLEIFPEKHAFESPSVNESALTPGEAHKPMLDFFRGLIMRDEMKAYRENLVEDWGSLEWLSYRLAEILPIVDETRQALLEMACEERVELLQRFMKSNKFI